MDKIQGSKYTHRLLARFIIEAETPLAIGTGEKDIFTDSCVVTDINGLPYIPGSTIAGVVRSMIDPEKKRSLFGYQKKTEGRGSEIIFTEGKILSSNGKPVDGICRKVTIMEDQLLKQYAVLPIRQHVRINDKGTAADKGKFDEQVVFAGSRFCFEIEIVSDSEESQILRQIIDTVKNNVFRLGGGTRKGFGCIRVEDVKTVILNLCDTADLTLYTQKSACLSDDWSGWKKDSDDEMSKSAAEWKEYKLTLTPKDFVMFGSGFGDDDGNADMTTVKASKVKWENGKGKLETDQVLIPATSLKGALRHRTAFHYNKQKGVKAEELSEEEIKNLSENNPAAISLFGDCKNGKATRGNVILNDIIMHESHKKLINHIAVDHFTGGTIDGALFTEQVDYIKDKCFETVILINEKRCNKEYIDALKESLNDVVNGLLPLGGGVNRGHGIFRGTFKKVADND